MPPVFYYNSAAGDINFAKVSCQLKCVALYKKGSKGVSGKHAFSESAFTTLLLTRPMDALATNFS